MKKILICLLLLIPALQGCNKYLDLQPKGITIPQYYDDYYRIMNYAQVQKAGDHYTALITDDVQFTSADSLYSYTTAAESYQRLYSFQHGAIYNAGVQDYIWELAYNRIYYFNVIINNIMNVPDATEAKKLNLKAEALFARAFENFTLLVAYAKPYNAATAATDLGVPVIETEDVGNINYKRNTVAEVYNKIEADLNEALPNLLVTVPNSFRPSQSVGYAFRARVELYRQEFSKAMADAKTAVALNTNLVNLNNYGIKPGNITIGRICKLPGLTEPYPEGINNPENIYTRYLPTVFGLNGALYASNDLLDVYTKDLPAGQEDKRRTLWYSDNKFTTYNFPGRTMYCFYVRANVGLSSMEAMLTAAECYARAGGADNLTEAARLYNLLRKNRISNYTDINFSSAAEALTKVLDERRREFAFLGLTRFTDLKRLNNEAALAKTVVHTANGQTWTLPPGDLRYVLPVPPNVKSFNPGIPDYER
jgi:hypothetical protein